MKVLEPFIDPVSGELYLPDEDVKKPARHTIFKPRTRKPNFIWSAFVGAFRLLCAVILLLGLAGVGAVIGIAKAYVETAPDLDLAELSDQEQTSFIYDAGGNLITDYKGTQNRVMVSAAEMPANLQNAFVAVEDARFYTHNGVDLKRIVGAFISNIVSGTNQGGSTITCQLIKNTMLSSEQSYKRKIQEAYLAMQLEARYSKEQILESYLNTIYLGENYYGVKTAAMGFFGKELSELTLRECAMLAGVTTNPYYYNPRRNFYLRTSETTDYKKLTNDRTDYVLRCMYENQFITYEQFQSALDTSGARVLESSGYTDELYPYVYYVEYAITDVVSKLLEINSLEDNAKNRAKMENELRTGGYSVTLCIDTEIQKIVEDTLENWSSYPIMRNPSDKVYRARNADGTYTEIIQPQAAAVVYDYRTGELKAIVGGRTQPTQRKTLNRAVDMNMPVGSSIKPISVYAPAVELGASPQSIVFNMPLPISGWTGSDGKDSWPKNYGGASYSGPETMRRALTKSHNTAAAYALMNYVGTERSADFLRQLGVSDKHINETPFGLALGSSGISPLEMAVAYGTLGNSGVYLEPMSFSRITDSTGKVIYDSKQNQESRRVFSDSTAYLTIDMMKDVVSSGTGTGAKIKGQTVAGKTGTNSDEKGVFFSGMTGWYSSALWIGHDNYKSLSSKTTGGGYAAKLWQSYMSKIHTAKNLGNQDILSTSPSSLGLVKVTTCNVSGQLATDACKNDVLGYGTTTGYWTAGTQPTSKCQMHQMLSVCTSSGMLANEYCPSSDIHNVGVVIIPPGHPLYKLIGGKYDSVLEKYLGEYSTLRLTTDTNKNNALIQSRICNVHNSHNSISAADQVLTEAKTLAYQAEQYLLTLTSQADTYMVISSALRNLNSVISSSPSNVSALTAAMSTLRNAMNTQ